MFKQCVKDFGKLFAAEVLTEMMGDKDPAIKRMSKAIYYGCGLDQEIQKADALKVPERKEVRDV